MNDLHRSKQQTRAEALARRNALPEAYRAEAARAMTEFAALVSLAPGEWVAGYWPIRSEPDVRPVMQRLRDRGARLCLPVVTGPGTIEFREYREDARLVESGFGTMGPDGSAARVDPTLLLVPLTAFDGAGNRLGYGAGFYDRAIARLRESGLRPRLIGVAFDCQCVPAIGAEQHDARLDAVLTESGLRYFPA
jgi:5-formyltetrahydrofolate cyclo-ligase